MLTKNKKNIKPKLSTYQEALLIRKGRDTSCLILQGRSNSLVLGLLVLFQQLLKLNDMKKEKKIRTNYLQSLKFYSFPHIQHTGVALQPTLSPNQMLQK